MQCFERSRMTVSLRSLVNGIILRLISDGRILRIPYTAHVTNEEVRRSHQSPLPSYQGDYVCSDISHELIHHKIIPVPFRQPSSVFQPTGATGEADHVEPGSVPSSLTCNRPTLASTRRGFAHKIVPNGVQLWIRLCSPLVMMMMMIIKVTRRCFPIEARVFQLSREFCAADFFIS